ncbi:MAG: 1-phosphofructokinase family hexose kinase [Candidatus Izemoplasmataceae bacterium]
MIYTCTLNPAIDYRLELDTFSLGALNRASFNKFSGGGKGINVSILLKELGVDNTALGFVGGFTGAYLKDYLKETYDLKMAFTPIKDLTRINVKLQIKSDNTEVNAKAPVVSKEEFDDLVSKVNELGKDDLFILGGSTIEPKYDAYLVLAEKCFNNQVPFVIDTEKENLLKTLPFKPFLIKPNRYELEQLTNQSIHNEFDLIKAAKDLLVKGAQNIIVSLGKEGSYFINDTLILKALPIKGKALNPVGAGDSMVAGFVSEYIRSKDLIKSYKMSIASGTATAFSYSIAKKETVHKYLKNVKIEEVKV